MADASILSLSMVEPDIAAITLDDPNKGANVLSSTVLDDLEKILDQLDSRQEVAGLIVRSGKPGMFIAGADLKEFLQWIDSPSEEVIAFCRRGQQLYQRLCSSHYVTVAAIDGICVGGGAELAIWCDRRLMTTERKTQYGFPEVKLGLFPGWGGTARTPRIVGLSNAVELVTGGESIDAATAVTMGLATDAVQSDSLEAAAISLIRAELASGQYLTDRQQWAAPIEMSETELGFLGATASAYIQQLTKGNYPAPIAALEVMLGATGVDVDAACQMEAEGFAEVFGSPVNRALLNVFFLQDRNKKDKGVTQKEIEPGKIRSVGVVGSGVMGQGIAGANVRRKIPVAITDTNSEALREAASNILSEVSYNKATRGPDVQKAVELAPLINATTSQGEIAACDLVIEAVVENEEIKKKVLRGIEEQLAEDGLLASNTSTIPITQLAAGLQRPEQFCGIHFFNPVRSMPLVEVIRGEQTSDQTVATAVAYAKSIGKSPVVVRDGPGFLVNRLLLPYMTESLELLLEGATIREVEKASKSFGMPMGPITLFDVVGLDVAIFAGKVMADAFPDRLVTSELLVSMFEAGRIGQKVGKGFYLYENKKGKGTPDPEIDALIGKMVRSEKKFTNEELQMRMFLPMLIEATRILEEALVRSPQDVDLGMIYGTGFPPFKGGLMFWGDTLGAAEVLKRLEPLEPIGKRYEPTEMLKQMAASGEKFYKQ